MKNKMELDNTYKALVKIASRHSKDLVASQETNGYILNSDKPVKIGPMNKKGIGFLSVVPRKNYIGVYFMPIYTDPSIKSKIPKKVLSTLKGKSCFHIKKLTPDLETQLDALVKLGRKTYEKKGWI